MRDLSAVQLTVNGVPVASLADMQELAYAVPEDKTLPSAFAHVIAGESVSPHQLFEACTCARDVVGDSDAALEILEVVEARLLRAFPQDAP